VLHAACGERGSRADEREHCDQHCSNDYSSHALLLALMRLPGGY